MEHEQRPARPQHPYELGDELRDHLLAREVLEHEVAVHEIEGAIAELPQVVGVVYQEPARVDAGVEFLGRRDHGVGDVHAVAIVEVLGERPGQPPDAAAEIQGGEPILRVSEPLPPRHDPVDVRLSRPEELRNVPPTELV